MSAVLGPQALLSRREAATYLGISPRSLAQWAWRGEGPAFYKVGGRARYRREDLDAYLAARRRAGGEY